MTRQRLTAWPRRPVLGYLAALLTIAWLVAAPAPVQAQSTCEVTNLDDAGTGSLRAHITDEDCDLIGFHPDLLPGTIELASQLTVDRATNTTVGIEGPGAGSLTISGQGSVRVLRILDGNTVTISGVTIAAGRAAGFFSSRNTGGGIRNLGDLTITDTTFSHNSAVKGGGIWTLGTLTLTGTTFSGNRARSSGGGAIWNNGAELTVRASTLSGNRAGHGGGAIRTTFGSSVTVRASTLSDNSASFGGALMLNGSTLTVIDSTLSGNAASGNGGGILNPSNSTATVRGSTLSGNAAGRDGGGIWNAGAATVENSTLSGNSADVGGGVGHVDGTASFKNSVVADSPSGGNCAGDGDLVAVSVNLDDDGTCDGFTEEDELLLGVLADNGGPTRTHALQPESPAVHAVTDCTLLDGETPVATDQRGVDRPQGPACDVGAFELEMPVIEVFPGSVEFGVVEVDETSTAVVTIANEGDGDLEVADLSLASGSPFSITAAPSTPAVIPPDSSEDVEITFAPTATGEFADTLRIESDDPVRGLVEVPLGGTGEVTDLPPEEEIQAILDLFDEAVDDGRLEGSGPGASGPGRLDALRNMLLAASDLIQQGETEDACGQLRQAVLRTDGAPRPPDFVDGEAASELAQRIADLMDDLGCS